MRDVKNQREFIIISIELSNIKRFFIMDMGIGSLSYSLFRMISPHFIVDMLGSIVVTEGLKRGIPLFVQWQKEQLPIKQLKINNENSEIWLFHCFFLSNTYSN